MQKGMRAEMPKAVRKDLARVLKKAQRLINNGDSNKLKQLSDYTIQNASLFQDPDSLTAAIAVYAISKLVERWGPESEHAEQVRNLMGSAHFSLEQNKLEEYTEKMKNLMEFIANVEQGFKLYVEKVIEKAQIKKGSSIYEHGISAARTAELLGIGQWELMSYIGRTRIHDDVPESMSGVIQRLDYARSLFENGGPE